MINKNKTKSNKNQDTFLREFLKSENELEKDLFFKRMKEINFNYKFCKLKSHYLNKGYSNEEANKQTKLDIKNKVKIKDLDNKKAKKVWNKNNHSVKDLRSGKISIKKAS